MTSLETTVEDIRSMRVHGAGRIARHAVQGLLDWEAALRDASAFDRGFRDAVRALGDTRPTAVSLHNALAYVERHVERAADVSAKRTALRKAASEFIERSKQAVAEIGRQGAAILPRDGTFMTICNSHAALGVFVEMKRQGGDPRVYALETRPFRQGWKSARHLADAGVDVTLIVDGAAMSFIRDVDAVVTGCDTLAANGDVVNKVGTSALALIAREAGKPFYTAGETYKVDLGSPTGGARRIEERDAREICDPGELPGVKFRNPVFDVTPHAWVTRILTEEGALPPQEVGAVARKLWA